MTCLHPIGGLRNVGQGEFHVAETSGVVLTAVLGSCVAACLWDSEAGVGGMNHMVLPDGEAGDLGRVRVGVNEMELLINGILRSGGARSRPQAKLFGGARMVAGLSDVGVRNARFAADFLAREGIPLLSTSLGGTKARRVQFWPQSGRARQRILEMASLPDEPRVVAPMLQRGASDVELF